MPPDTLHYNNLYYTKSTTVIKHIFSNNVMEDYWKQARFLCLQGPQCRSGTGAFCATLWKCPLADRQQSVK